MKIYTRSENMNIFRGYTSSVATIYGAAAFMPDRKPRFPTQRPRKQVFATLSKLIGTALRSIRPLAITKPAVAEAESYLSDGNVAQPEADKPAPYALAA